MWEQRLSIGYWPLVTDYLSMAIWFGARVYLVLTFIGKRSRIGCGSKSKYFKHQQKDAPLIEIIHWKPLKFLQSSAITVDWLYFVYNVTRASMDAIQWCRRGVEQFEYTAHSQLNTFSLLRNKQFCWATDSFNIDVAHAYFVRPWSSSDRLSSHIGNLDYLDNKNLFLVPLFCAAKSSV